MSANPSSPLPLTSLPAKDTLDGPITRAHLRRSRRLHWGLCFLGALPWLLDAPAGWQAFGWGLWLPGAGFLAIGGWSLLLFPVTLTLFGVAFFAWFGAGMIIAPTAVWLGSALTASLIAASATGINYTPWAVPTLTLSWLAWARLWRERRRRKALARRNARNAYLPAELAEISRIAVAAPPLNERALTVEQLGMLRYVLDRALQPLGTLHGFDHLDQFQTAALRYQLNQIGYTLAVVQRHYTPNFHGYLSEGQRRAILQYLRRPIWGYWRWENAWGNFDLDFNPVKKDNIMLTGYLNINALLYMNNTGDLRYAQPGSLSFHYDERRRFPHDVHSINGSLLDNFRGQVYSQPYCLFPCEPNWIYTACNFRGLTSVLLHDTVFGSDDLGELRTTFRRRLEEEFTDIDASIVALRSKITGHALPFPVPDATLVKMLAPLFPDLSQRYWAIARHEILSSDRRRLTLRGRGIDFGNYQPGHLFAIDGVLGAAREMGDQEVADLALAALEEVVGRVERQGVVHFKGSNLANLMVMESHFGITGGWRDANCTRPPSSALHGPILSEASYPDVLVARAVSDGEDLQLLLHPGRAPEIAQTLSIERLQPHRRYRLDGAVESEAAADVTGRLRLQVQLCGPTVVRVLPLA